MSTIVKPGRTSLVALLATALAVVPAAAQEFPNFGGVETRLGVASTQDGGSGFAATLELDLGFLNNPALRGIAGFDYFGSDVEGELGREGSFDAAGAVAGVRWDLLVGRTQPYLVGVVTAHNVNANTTDALTEELLEGFYAGVGLGAGVMYGLGSDGRFNVVGDIRRVFANNIGRWSFAVGMRYLLSGAGAYVQEGERENGRLAADRRQAAEREREAARQEQRDAQGDEQVFAMEDESALYRELNELDRDLSVLRDVQQLDGGALLELGDGVFERGSASLTMTGQNELARLSRMLMDYSIRTVMIEAFTNAAGFDAENRQLAQRRAEAVRTALVREGLDPLRITASGQVETGGMERPEDGRVEILLRGISGSSR